jgi:hypothetical protein
MNEAQIKPWYNYFWVWFMLSLLGTVIIAGFITLYLAIAHPDPVVRQAQAPKSIKSLFPDKKQATNDKL